MLSLSSFENMAKTRSSGKKEETKKSILLPDMWVTHYQTSRSGRTVNLCYLNLRTGQKFYSKQAFYRHFRTIAAQSHDCLKKEAAINRKPLVEEEKDHICSRCKEIGHNCVTCPYPIIYKINPFAGRRLCRCSRCHCFGHNVRTCNQSP